MTKTVPIVLIASATLGLAWAWPAGDLHAKAGMHLLAVLAWATAGTGALLLLAIANLVGAQWGESMHAPLRAAAASLPALAVFFVPILALWPTLNGFVQGPRGPLSGNLALWFSPAFFSGRAVLYWITWALACILWRAPQRQGRAAVYSAVVVSITLTLAAFDWIMGLAAPWQSTILGVYVAAGSLIAGLSLATLLALLGARARGMRLPAPLVRTLARLQFTLCFFWGYVGICQVIIIHMADLPEEVVWCLQRVEGRFASETIAVVLGQCFVPMGVLLFDRMKRSRLVLGLMALWCLGWHAVDVHWLVMPSVRGAESHPFLSALAWLAVGSVAMVCTLNAQRDKAP